ncbi:hypothetical protein PIB30_097188 [Stylosanthes scabra]|uniref:Uncharacterized protein n=1 Tax=Stylosanthes scabra TaxID=79078 RepID=A0ABU6QWW5_9FABA|nr:hypothetical protein [Stylosanthes scabra]
MRASLMARASTISAEEAGAFVDVAETNAPSLFRKIAAVAPEPAFL